MNYWAWWSALKQIFSMLQQLLQGQARIMASLDDIKAKEDAEAAVEGQILTLMQQMVAKQVDLAQQLQAALANAADPAKLQALADEIDANTKAMSDALAGQ